MPPRTAPAGWQAGPAGRFGARIDTVEERLGARIDRSEERSRTHTWKVVTWKVVVGTGVGLYLATVATVATVLGGFALLR